MLSGAVDLVLGPPGEPERRGASPPERVGGWRRLPRGLDADGAAAAPMGNPCVPWGSAAGPGGVWEGELPVLGGKAQLHPPQLSHSVRADLD